LRKEPQPIVDPLDRFACHFLGTLRSGREHSLQFGEIGRQFVDSVLDRAYELDDGLGGVLLQVALAAPSVALDELVDVDSGDRRPNAQQV
jgi:hypothetical protein